MSDLLQKGKQPVKTNKAILHKLLFLEKQAYILITLYNA